MSRGPRSGKRRGKTARDAGFSLLEVMVAMALLALALVVLVGITTQNVRATQHARQVTVATFLSRAKMSDVEDRILQEGFVDNDETEEGDFTEQLRPEFRWKTLIEKVELPTDMTQQTQAALQDTTQQQSSNPLMAMAGMMGGFMTTLIDPIRVGLQESVRRVTVRVAWDEPGRAEQSFEVVTFMTDPAKLDLAMQAVGQPGAGAQGTQSGQAGASGSTGTNRPAAAQPAPTTKSVGQR
jgi:general secretion pathway protein I